MDTLKTDWKRWLKESPLFWIFKPIIRWIWKLRGQPVPPPQAIKEQVLVEYGKRFHCQVLIETGTLWGDTPIGARKHFKKIYTIELDDALHARAKKRFKPWPHLVALKGDSGVVIQEVLEQLEEPAVFWLDGHASGGITARGIMYTPIVQELEKIFAHRIGNHVIIIDDARLFTGVDDYPLLEELTTWIRERRPQTDIEVKGDSIRITTKYSLIRSFNRCHKELSSPVGPGFSDRKSVRRSLRKASPSSLFCARRPTT